MTRNLSMAAGWLAAMVYGMALLAMLRPARSVAVMVSVAAPGAVVAGMASDTELAMGNEAKHGRFVHLYINGLYWGLYDLTERPEATWAAQTWGGTTDDYDVIANGVIAPVTGSVFKEWSVYRPNRSKIALASKRHEGSRHSRRRAPRTA